MPTNINDGWLFKPNCRICHWNCSKFANWIRGKKKPHALTYDAWIVWEEEQSKERPWRYWLSDTVLSKLQRLLNMPKDVWCNLGHYIRNRWFNKTQYLHTGLEPGHYYDLDHRMMCGLFHSFVLFLESDIAPRASWSYPDKKYVFKNGRCKEALYDHWRWEQDTKNDDGTPSTQAESSKETQALYEWWTITRVNRIDPYDLYSPEKKENVDDDMCNFNNLPETRRGAYQLINELDKAYTLEDTDKMIELIKIRGCLWA